MYVYVCMCMRSACAVCASYVRRMYVVCTRACARVYVYVCVRVCVSIENEATLINIDSRAVRNFRMKSIAIFRKKIINLLFSIETLFRFNECRKKMYFRKGDQMKLQEENERKKMRSI